MKIISKFTDAGSAFGAIDKLSEAGIYSAMSGCVSRGYELLVRDSQEDAAILALYGTANETNVAQFAFAGGNK